VIHDYLRKVEMSRHRERSALLLVALMSLLGACTAQSSGPTPTGPSATVRASPAPSVLNTSDNVYAGSNDSFLYSL
jgi:hypothetical protein